MARDNQAANATESANPRDELEERCRQLEAQVKSQAFELSLLRGRFLRYETALRGSNIVVYTQDLNLRYTSISHPMLGHSIADILGRTDEDILPAEAGSRVAALKREALATGESKRTEIAFDGSRRVCWHDLHIEPLHNDTGEIIGLTSASVDVTDRKEGEAHLRLLLRELTHRSKNLLAVIQAMARQTARHTGSIDNFLDRFSARLQALAASHDLLVRESWYGASLGELVRSQLTAYLDRGEEQISVEGLDVALKPEAAQNLGLALHELSVNAAKFGALSIPEGRVMIAWRKLDGGGGDAALELDWRESAGPKVRGRRKHGFGSMVIEKNLARALDAEVEMKFEPDGLQCRVVIPASWILAPR